MRHPRASSHRTGRPARHRRRRGGTARPWRVPIPRHPARIPRHPPATRCKGICPHDGALARGPRRVARASAPVGPVSRHHFGGHTGLRPGPGPARPRGCAARSADRRRWRLDVHSGDPPFCATAQHLPATRPARRAPTAARAREREADAVAAARSLGLLPGSALDADVEHYDRTERPPASAPCARTSRSGPGPCTATATSPASTSTRTPVFATWPATSPPRWRDRMPSGWRGGTPSPR